MENTGFGVLRLNLNWDYDRLVEMANNHKTIRKMVGHGSFTDDYEYKLQTLKDNVTLLTPEIRTSSPGTTNLG